MKTIYKYPLAVADRQVVEMPAFATVLCVQAQGDRPCVWALVDDGEATFGERIVYESRTFATFGTGHPINGDPGTYIGTYQLEGGALVFHVFEVAP